MHGQQNIKFDKTVLLYILVF